MRFETWLKKQKKRDDPIGDLACDYISTGHRGTIETSPYWGRACDGAVKALKAARKEYAKFLQSCADCKDE